MPSQEQPYRIAVLGSMNTAETTSWREALCETVTEHTTHPVEFLDPTSSEKDRRRRIAEVEIPIFYQADAFVLAIGPDTAGTVSLTEARIIEAVAHRNPHIPVYMHITNPEAYPDEQMRERIQKNRWHVQTETQFCEDMGITGEGQIRHVSSYEELTDAVIAGIEHLEQPFPRRDIWVPQTQYAIVTTGSTKGRDNLLTVLTEEGISYTDTRWDAQVSQEVRQTEAVQKELYTQELSLIASAETVIVQEDPSSFNHLDTFFLAVVLAIAHHDEHPEETPKTIIRYISGPVSPRLALVGELHLDAMQQAYPDAFPTIHVAHTPQEVAEIIHT